MLQHVSLHCPGGAACTQTAKYLLSSLNARSMFVLCMDDAKSGVYNYMWDHVYVEEQDCFDC